MGGLQKGQNEKDKSGKSDMLKQTLQTIHLSIIYATYLSGSRQSWSQSQPTADLATLLLFSKFLDSFNLLSRCSPVLMFSCESSIF